MLSLLVAAALPLPAHAAPHLNNTEPPAATAARLLLVWADLQALRPALAPDPNRANQVRFLDEHIANVATLVDRARRTPSARRGAIVGTDLASYALDLMRIDYEATQARVAGAVRGPCNLGLASAWGGLRSLRADPDWATRYPQEAYNMLRSADNNLSFARDMLPRAFIGRRGVEAASIASGGKALMEIGAVGIAHLGRVAAWMRGAQIERGSLVLASTGGTQPTFRIVAPTASLSLTDAEVAALGASRQLPPIALQLYMAARDRDVGSLLGDGPEARAVRETGRAGAGVVRPPRHHVLPQEQRAWFEARGFRGETDIDNFCVELAESSHQAVHGGGNPWLGRTWPGEWNREVMRRLLDRETDLGRMLTPKEVLKVVETLMSRYNIPNRFVRFRGP